jgi:ubiquinone/menaquinone biosynthesis C-methylase UbiE
MLAIAKTRAKSLGLDSIMDFRESDAGKLDFPEPTVTFDAIISRSGLIFLQNLPATLLRIDRC